MYQSPHMLVELARWLGRHPSGLVRWEEGIAAIKSDEGTLLVTPPGRSLESMRAVDLIEVSHAKLLEPLKSDVGGESEIQKTITEAKLRSEDPNPSPYVFLLAYLLSFDGVKAVAH